MPQSFGQIYLHVVFAAKNRQPLIVPNESERLYAYVGAVLRDLGCPSLVIGGTEDHIHILHSLARTRSVATIMEKVKANSSRWMKQQRAADFWWQPGYAVFSVGRSELDRVIHYIQRQREHHRLHTFDQEMHELCAHDSADANALAEFLREEPQRGDSSYPGE